MSQISIDRARVLYVRMIVAVEDMQYNTRKYTMRAWYKWASRKTGKTAILPYLLDW